MKKLLAIPHIPENIAWAILTAHSMTPFEKAYQYPFTEIGTNARLIEPQASALSNPKGGHLFFNYNDAKMILEDSGLAAGKVVPVLFKKVTALSEMMPASKLSEKHMDTRPIDFKVGDLAKINIPDTVLQSGFDTCPFTGKTYWIPDGLRRIQGCSGKVFAAFNPDVRRYHLNLIGCSYQFLPNWLERVEEVTPAKSSWWTVGTKVRLKVTPEMEAGVADGGGALIHKYDSGHWSRVDTNLLSFKDNVLTINEVDVRDSFVRFGVREYGYYLDRDWLEKVTEPETSFKVGDIVRFKEECEEFKRGHYEVEDGKMVSTIFLEDMREDAMLGNAAPITCINGGLIKTLSWSGLHPSWLEKVEREVTLPTGPVPCVLGTL